MRPKALQIAMAIAFIYAIMHCSSQFDEAVPKEALEAYQAAEGLHQESEAEKPTDGMEKLKAGIMRSAPVLGTLLELTVGKCPCLDDIKNNALTIAGAGLLATCKAWVGDDVKGAVWIVVLITKATVADAEAIPHYSCVASVEGLPAPDCLLSFEHVGHLKLCDQIATERDEVCSKRSHRLCKAATQEHEEVCQHSRAGFQWLQEALLQTGAGDSTGAQRWAPAQHKIKGPLGDSSGGAVDTENLLRLISKPELTKDLLQLLPSETSPSTRLVGESKDSCSVPAAIKTLKHAVKDMQAEMKITKAISTKSQESGKGLRMRKEPCPPATRDNGYKGRWRPAATCEGDIVLEGSPQGKDKQGRLLFAKVSGSRTTEITTTARFAFSFWLKLKEGAADKHIPILYFHEKGKWQSQKKAGYLRVLAGWGIFGINMVDSSSGIYNYGGKNVGGFPVDSWVYVVIVSTGKQLKMFQNGLEVNPGVMIKEKEKTLFTGKKQLVARVGLQSGFTPNWHRKYAELADVRFHPDITAVPTHIPATSLLKTRKKRKDCRWPDSIFVMSDPVHRKGICVGTIGHLDSWQWCSSASGRRMCTKSTVKKHHAAGESFKFVGRTAGLLLIYLVQKTTACLKGACSVSKKGICVACTHTGYVIPGHYYLSNGAILTSCLAPRKYVLCERIGLSLDKFRASLKTANVSDLMSTAKTGLEDFLASA